MPIWRICSPRVVPEWPWVLELNDFFSSAAAVYIEKHRGDCMHGGGYQVAALKSSIVMLDTLREARSSEKDPD